LNFGRKLGPLKKFPELSGSVKNNVTLYALFFSFDLRMSYPACNDPEIHLITTQKGSPLQTWNNSGGGVLKTMRNLEDVSC
jgi:hypothetical protein